MRLIDADVLLEVMKKKFILQLEHTGYPVFVAHDVMSWVLDAPTAAEGEATHGYWTPQEGAPFILKCSHCGHSMVTKAIDIDWEHDYCPHCGAKMDLEQP